MFEVFFAPTAGEMTRPPCRIADSDCRKFSWTCRNGAACCHFMKSLQFFCSPIAKCSPFNFSCIQKCKSCKWPCIDNRAGAQNVAKLQHFKTCSCITKSAKSLNGSLRFYFKHAIALFEKRILPDRSIGNNFSEQFDFCGYRISDAAIQKTKHFFPNPFIFRPIFEGKLCEIRPLGTKNIAWNKIHSWASRSKREFYEFNGTPGSITSATPIPNKTKYIEFFKACEPTNNVEPGANFLPISTRS